MFHPCCRLIIDIVTVAFPQPSFHSVLTQAWSRTKHERKRPLAGFLRKTYCGIHARDEKELCPGAASPFYYSLQCFPSRVLQLQTTCRAPTNSVHWTSSVRH